MAASAAVAQPQQHQTLPSFPADDHPGVDPPALYPGEAISRFARGEFGDADADLLELLRSLEHEHARLEVREEDVRIEMGDLRKEARRCEAELTRVQLQARPLVVARLDEVVDEDHAVVTVPETSNTLYLSKVDRALLAPSASVLMLASSPGAVVGVLSPAEAAGSSAAAVDSFLVTDDEDTPSVTYDDIAGCEAQKREVREAVELPLTHPELFARLGVDPPRGVLLHGPPGTGKTMLARAVARHTSASFLRVSGAELAGGRFLGSGPRMVRDVFRQVFQACAKGMSLDGDVGLEDLAARRDGMSAAEIAAVCFEAGMRAVRGNRRVVTREDFEQGYRAVAEKLERDAYHEFSFYS